MARISPKYTAYPAIVLVVIWAITGGNGSYALPKSGQQQHTAYSNLPVAHPDSLPVPPKPASANAGAPQTHRPDSLRQDSVRVNPPATSATAKNVTQKISYKNGFLDDVINGKNKDSLVYEPAKKMVYIYEKGDINYQNMNLKADYIQVDMQTKDIFAYGRMDSVVNKKTQLSELKQTRPEFSDGGEPYLMDTIHYNLASKKAKIKGMQTKDGEGYLTGREIKKMPDNTINIAHGEYTTCDDVDHPHYYIEMTKAKVIPGKKIIVGPSYMVFEDVPLYFMGVPFGFFPIMSKRSSGFIVPEYGEEYNRGFFLRNGGYYFTMGEYADATFTGGIYTLGSWEANVNLRYMKRYKFNGGFLFNYSKVISGEKGQSDYVNQSNFRVQWSHTQDPKFRPNTQFSASVNFSSSGYSKYSSQTISDYLNTQTSSSISYSHNWPGKPMSLSMSMNQSQNSSDKTISLGLPNLAFNVTTIYPFRRKEMIGKERWYEKVNFTYNMQANSNVLTTDKEIFTEQMLKNVKVGVQHTIPVSATFSILNYINFTPSVSYNEKWYFRSIERAWDPAKRQVMNADTTYGFYRLYNYSFNAAASTKIYGTYQFGKKSVVQAIRHVMTPNVGFSFSPDFANPKYGFYKPVQTDSTGTISYYSPFAGELYGGPGGGRNASLTFGLVNTLEMKVRSKADTTGSRKIKLIQNLSASSSWNFLADSLNLSNFPINLRTGNIIGNFGIDLSATLDPYQINDKGRRINKFMLNKGSPGRIVSASWSFQYTFHSTKQQGGAINDITSATTPTAADNPEFFTDARQQADAATRRLMMSQQYYDFDIPWNLGFNYMINYAKPGLTASTTQTIAVNGSVTLTKKLGVTFSGGYDIMLKKITIGSINISRDLHCWQMTFTWVPLGYLKQWSFYIGVKSSMLKDLKYDKRSSMYDNLNN